VCCSVLQCAAVCCSVLQCAAMCVAACCSVLQCVAVFCSVLQCATVCCSALQCVAMFCSVLQFVVGGGTIYISTNVLLAARTQHFFCYKFLNIWKISPLLKWVCTVTVQLTFENFPPAEHAQWFFGCPPPAHSAAGRTFSKVSSIVIARTKLSSEPTFQNFWPRARARVALRLLRKRISEKSACC